MVQASLLLALAAFTGLMEASPIQRRAGSGKRGVVFPKNHNGQSGSQWAQLFTNSPVSWMYDWEAVIDGEAPKQFEYVPLLHSNQGWCTEGWSQNVANAAKKYTVKNILSFNEPDQCGGGGTCMGDIDQAVAAHRQYIQPLASQYNIGSPAVTNGGESTKGISYLRQFMSKCSDCKIDFVVAHYYGTDEPQQFIDYITKFHDTFQKPVWVTEFGLGNGGDASKLLRGVLPWLEKTEWIQRYSYHMAAPDNEGKSYLVNAAGNGLSSTGVTYTSA